MIVGTKLAVRCWNGTQFVPIGDLRLSEINDGPPNLIYTKWIGAKDRGEKLIFEGDIVKINDGRIYLILWENLAWHKRQIGDKWNSTIFTNNKPDSKAYVDIIGNMFQTPELLEHNKFYRHP